MRHAESGHKRLSLKIIDFLDNRLTGGERAESGGTGRPWDQWQLATVNNRWRRLTRRQLSPDT